MMSKNGNGAKHEPARRSYDVFVTPAMAEKWLEGNVVNRDLKPHNIANFERKLRRGEFRLTHQGLAFSPEGQLLDGQHRLWAIFNTGIGAWIMVTENQDPNAFPAMDGGIIRSLADHAGLPQKQVGVVATIMRIANRSSAPLTEEQKLSITHALIDDVVALFAVSGLEKRGLTTAPIKAGFVAFGILNPRRQDWAYGQYDLYVHGKLRDCAESIASLYTRFLSNRDVEADQFLRVYHALRAPNASKTLIRDITAATAIARDVMQERGVEPFWTNELALVTSRKERDRTASRRSAERASA